jgi:adenylyltransferase/sulfurtransferase
VESVDLREDRYHRQSLIQWWDQQRVRKTRILVIGAGALGNEILKLLALIGSGYTLVYDPDRIERSNLSRTVLFREADEGQGKAEVAVRRMREINADVKAHAYTENILVKAGLGVFHWADVVIGAVDNREARVFINSMCARVGKKWVDGAIEALSGVVRVFDPKNGPCYECTMNGTDRKLLAERRSCAMLAREAVTRGHVPTSAVAASIIGSMEVQEAIKVCTVNRRSRAKACTSTVCSPKRAASSTRGAPTARVTRISERSSRSGVGRTRSSAIFSLARRRSSARAHPWIFRGISSRH